MNIQMLFALKNTNALEIISKRRLPIAVAAVLVMGVARVVQEIELYAVMERFPRFAAATTGY